MKRFLLLSTLLLLGVGKSWAVIAPVDAQGHALATIDFVGANNCNIDAATGTQAVLCGSTTTVNIVYGVIATSIPFTAYLVLRDTDVVTSNGSTVTMVAPTIIASSASVFNASQLIKFPVPIRFTKGICAVSTVAPGTGSIWTILYRQENVRLTAE